MQVIAIKAQVGCPSLLSFSRLLGSALLFGSRGFGCGLLPRRLGFGERGFKRLDQPLADPAVFQAAPLVVEDRGGAAAGERFTTGLVRWIRQGARRPKFFIEVASVHTTARVRTG